MKKTGKSSFILRLFILATIFTGLANNIATSQANLRAQQQIIQHKFTNDLSKNLSLTPTDLSPKIVSFVSLSKPLRQTFHTAYTIEHIHPLSNSKFLVESVDALHLLANSGNEIACIAKPVNFEKIIISPDKRFFAIATSSYCDTVFAYLYTTATLESIGEPLKIEEQIQDGWKVWISPDSSSVILSDGCNLEFITVQIPTSPLRKIIKSKLELEDVIISPNGKFFIRINVNGTAQIYAIDTITCTLKKIGNPFSSVHVKKCGDDPIKISNNSEFITVFFANHTAQIYSINTESRSYTPVGNPIQNIDKGKVNTAIEISPNNAFILVNHRSGRINTSFQVYNSKTGQPFNFVLGEDHDVWRTKITPDSKFILEEHQGKLDVYSVNSAAQTITLKYSIDNISCGYEDAIKWSDSGKFFVTCNEENNIDLYETESGKQIGDSKPKTEGAPDESICAYFLRNDEIIVIDNSNTMDVYSTTGFNRIDKLEANGFVDNHAHNSFIIWGHDFFTLYSSEKELLSDDTTNTLSPEEILFIYNLFQLDEELTGKKIVLSTIEEKIMDQILKKDPKLAQQLIMRYHLIPAEGYEAKKRSLQNYENHKNRYISKLVDTTSQQMLRKNKFSPAELKSLQEKLMAAFLKRISDEGSSCSKKSLLAFAELLETSHSSLDQNLPSSQLSSLSVPQATNPSFASPQTRIVHQNHVCSQSSSQSNCGICGATMSQTNFAVTTPVTLGKRSVNSLEYEKQSTQQDKKMRGEEASLASTTQQATIMPPVQFLMPSTNPFTLQSTQQAQPSQAGTQSNTTNDIHMDHTTESHS